MSSNQQEVSAKQDDKSRPCKACSGKGGWDDDSQETPYRHVCLFCNGTGAQPQ